MPDKVYEVVAQGARYWFLFLMFLIAWRSWRWYRRDQRKAKKRRKLLPDAGFVGEMVVIDGGGVLHPGAVFAVPCEGTLGSLRTNDLCLPVYGVRGRHLWFRFDERKGLLVEPFGKNIAEVDGQLFEKRKNPLYMAHGSCLCVGEVQLCLRLFAGFETVGYALRREMEMPEPQPQAAPAQLPAEDAAVQQQMLWMQQQWMMQQQAYEQGYRQAMAQTLQMEELEEEEEEPVYEDQLPYDMAQIAQEEGMVDQTMFMRPKGQPKPEMPERTEAPAYHQPQTFYAPVEEEGEEWPAEPEMDEAWSTLDEDMTDAAAPPKSAYVGHDEASRAKRRLDRYFGGGQR